MSNYLEERTRPDFTPFDWTTFLTEGATHTLAEWGYAFQLSNDWVTCACGNQCNIIPRNYIGAPEDSALYNLGNAFNHAIEGRQRGKALGILHKIEVRSATLIAQIQDLATLLAGNE